jgi:hypothetical protein
VAFIKISFGNNFLKGGKMARTRLNQYAPNNMAKITSQKLFLNI